MADDDGLYYVDENTVVSTMSGAAADDRHYSCPVAAASESWVSAVLKARHRIECGERLVDTLAGAHAGAKFRALIDIASRTIQTVQEAQREWSRRKRG